MRTGSKRMHVSLTGVSDPELIAPVWQDLEARSEHSYFISWAWIGTWLRMMPKAVRPMLMQAADGDRVVGLAVLAPRDVVRHRLVRSRSLYLHETGDSEI